MGGSVVLVVLIPGTGVNPQTHGASRLAAVLACHPQSVGQRGHPGRRGVGKDFGVGRSKPSAGGVTNLYFLIIFKF